MAVKCSKCGADIPDKAAFCPACGAPKGEAQTTSQPVQRTPTPVTSSAMATTSSPMEGFLNIVFSKTAIIIGIGIGILFGWIGVIIMIFAQESSDIAMLLSSMGFAGMGFMLLCGGIWNKKINGYARLAMVLIGGFLIVNGISIMSMFTSDVSSLFNGIPGFS
jgi:hypothetical protein